MNSWSICRISKRFEESGFVSRVVVVVGTGLAIYLMQSGSEKLWDLLKDQITSTFVVLSLFLSKDDSDLSSLMV